LSISLLKLGTSFAFFKLGGTITMGGDLGRTGGTVPQKFEVGDGSCICPPNISRSSVIGWVRK